MNVISCLVRTPHAEDSFIIGVDVAKSGGGLRSLKALEFEKCTAAIKAIRMLFTQRVADSS